MRYSKDIIEKMSEWLYDKTIDESHFSYMNSRNNIHISFTNYFYDLNEPINYPYKIIHDIQFHVPKNDKRSIDRFIQNVIIKILANNWLNNKLSSIKRCILEGKCTTNQIIENFDETNNHIIKTENYLCEAIQTLSRIVQFDNKDILKEYLVKLKDIHESFIINIPKEFLKETNIEIEYLSIR